MDSGSRKSIVEELIPKKVRFRDKEEETSNSMMIDLSSVQPTSWRDKLVGHSAEDVFTGSKEKEAIDILEEDIQKTFPWTLAFNPTQVYPSVVMAWIRFSALPSYLYNRKIITEIGELIGKVVKLDMNIDSRARGYFARMAILINGRSQKVEYESLSTICFHCGRYGYVENLYTFRKPGLAVEKNNDSPETTLENQNLVEEGSAKKDENYGPWMIVERKSR
ncbi:hypothetical protein GOBAR_DD31086 [Gossypium barbadense]|nr:hypothetical protein GOBAR_DD31086 [Gossypium barbadense]